MKRFWKPILAGCLLLLFAGLVLRLMLVVASTDTGWETLSGQFREATVGWFVEPEPQFGQLDPVDQGEFWIAEVDRILAENPLSPELLMGAALVLRAPTNLSEFGDTMEPGQFLRVGPLFVWGRQSL